MLFQLLLITIYICEGKSMYFGENYGNFDQPGARDAYWCGYTVDVYACNYPYIVQACPIKCFSASGRQRTRHFNQKSTRHFNQESLDCGVVKSHNGLSMAADLHEYPWHVGIYYKFGFACEGVLISDIFILTTSSCLNMLSMKNATRDEVVVTIGDHDLSTDDETDNQKMYPRTFIKHGKYNDPIPLNNDVGLVKLEARVKFSEAVSPICLPNPGNNYGNAVATIASWGRDPMSNYIKESPVRILRNDECKRSYSRDWIYKRIQRGQMCSIPKGTEKECANHRGAGVMVQENRHWVLIGLVSSSRGCGNVNKPAIIARITEYIDWIKMNGKRDAICKDDITTKCYELLH